MECRKAQEEIIESFEKARSADVQKEIDAHVAACPACAMFASRHKTLDARLCTTFKSPEMSPAFRTALRKRIRREKMRLWPDWLPDILHFASCGVATLFCARLLPFDASAVLGAGAAATLMTYVLLTAVRISFEDADDPG
jgi:hypothetical protein